ncbi:hypothetical protein K0M31_009318 [Melipona bicolor]|uniref:Uncharacterized protein n=1 Tax=Melipona bicolor TaxID=60889 RepID=A0AA40KJM7_9HYME|nr:hypothetical protein K0M31_009318 [Melipona bicolor]
MFEEGKKRKIRSVETVPTYLRICRVRVDIEFLEDILALEKTCSTMQEMTRKYVPQELQVARKRRPWEEKKKKRKERLKRLTLPKLLLRIRVCTEAKGTKEDWRSNQFGLDRLFRSRIESASLGKKKKKLAEESDRLGIVTICVPPNSADSRKKKQKKEKEKKNEKRKEAKAILFVVMVCIIHIDRPNRRFLQVRDAAIPFHPSGPIHPP